MSTHHFFTFEVTAKQHLPDTQETRRTVPRHTYHLVPPPPPPFPYNMRTSDLLHRFSRGQPVALTVEAYMYT